MSRLPIHLTALAALLALAACAQPGKTPAASQPAAAQPAAAARPGAMDPAKAAFDNLNASADHAVLVAALRAGGMVNRLRGEGPFTVMAPLDQAFTALPEGELARLMEPENKPDLVRLLNAHIVSGNLDGPALARALEAGKGRARLTTAAGRILTILPSSGGSYLLIDEQGNQARIVAGPEPQANGTVYAIDTLLKP